MSREKSRLDLWLWSIRIVKTRALASTACRKGHVKLDGKNSKPAQTVLIGQIYKVKIGPLEKTLEVLNPIQKRVSSVEAMICYKDHTPTSEIDRANQIAKENRLNQIFNKENKGKPSRKERELMKKLREDS